MTSPVLELQGAIVARLKADGTVETIAGDRVYDPPPAGASFPYLSIGPILELTDNAECIDAVEISFRVDAWSRASSPAEGLRLAAAVKAALHDADLTLTDNALVFIDHRSTNYLRDPDGLTRHAAIDFIAVIETPSPDSP